MTQVPLNVNEAKWLLAALRMFIASPAFGNDPEQVAQMGRLLAKIAAAAKVTA